MYERDEFLRDRIRPHQPGTPRGYSPRPPSGDRCRDRLGIPGRSRARSAQTPDRRAFWPRRRIVGIDADTAFGRLSSRIDPRAAGSFWELTTDTNLRSFTDITARLGRNSAGLYVLAGQPASGPRRVLDPAIYREAALRLDHHFAISVIDCGSSMEAAVTQEVLRDVDALIVVSSPWADGASAAANTIEWLSDYGLTGLLRRSIVVLNDSDGHADKRTKSLLAQEFIDHGQPVVEVPFDPHLRPGGVIDMSHEMAPTTRLKILQVAATVTAYFASRPADAHGSPPR
ncbi:chromosome partitioning ATPase [Mycobacterium tuberculosis]|nr:chromosome partitioning ATPase [Mycobacterium tuberculosis]